jgi:hypothetical protein
LRKKILRIAGSTLLLIVLGMLFLHSPLVKTKVLYYLKHQLAKSFNLSLSADALDYNLFTLRVSLKKLALKSLENPSQPPFFQADQAVLHLTTALILNKKIDLAAIYLEKPVINIHVYPDHSFNIPAKLFEKSEEPTPPVILRHIVLNNGRVFYHDPAKNLRANLQGFHLEGALPEKGKNKLILQLQVQGNGTGVFVFRDNTLRLDQAKITTRLDDGTVHVSLSDGEISGKGDYYSTSISTPGHLSLNWKNLNLQSPLLTNFFPHPVHSSTSGSLDLSFKELSLEGVRGNASASFLPLKTPPSQPGLIPLTGRIAVRLEPGKVTFPTFNLFARGNNIQGNLAINNNIFQGEINGVLNNTPPISGHLQISGRLNGDPANPKVLVRLQSNGIRISNIIELVPGGTLKYENGLLIIDRLLIRAQDAMTAQATISGTIPLKTLPGTLMGRFISGWIWPRGYKALSPTLSSLRYRCTPRDRTWKILNPFIYLSVPPVFPCTNWNYGARVLK